MKVSEILIESPLPDGWSITRDAAGLWTASDPDGTTRASGRIRGNVERDAQQWLRNNPQTTQTNPNNQTGDADGQRTNTDADGDARSREVPRELPKAEKDGLYKKIKKFFGASGKAVFGKLGGSFTALILSAMNIKDDFDMLIDQYVQSGCNRDQYVRHAEQTIRISLVEAVRDVLAGALGGIATTAAALALIPGLGWIASIGTGILGGIIGMVLAKMATNETTVANIASWIGDNVFLKDMTGLIDVMDDFLEELGYDIVACREAAAQNPDQFLIFEDNGATPPPKVSNAQMRRTGIEQKQEIINDPEIKRAVRRIKRQQSSD